MSNFKQLPYLAQIGIVALVILLLTGGAYWFALVPLDKANEADAMTLRTKQAEVNQLKTYKDKLKELTAQAADLQAKMEEQSKIVPEEKNVPSLITQVEAASVAAGIEIRRYTPKATSAKEYFTEVPVDIDVDGPFFSVLDFFTRLQNMDRIISVSHLKMGALKDHGGQTGVRRSYKWGPHETVAANCLLTTYYSNPKVAIPASAKKPAKAKR
jgi:type IV pilus assembly protein PilO